MSLYPFKPIFLSPPNSFVKLSHILTSGVFGRTPVLPGVQWKMEACQNKNAKKSKYALKSDALPGLGVIS